MSYTDLMVKSQMVFFCSLGRMTNHWSGMWHALILLSSDRGVAARGAGDVAEQAELGKWSKYSYLMSKYNFVTVSDESSGVFRKHMLLAHDFKNNKLILWASWDFVTSTAERIGYTTAAPHLDSVIGGISNCDEGLKHIGDSNELQVKVESMN